MDLENHGSFLQVSKTELVKGKVNQQAVSTVMHQTSKDTQQHQVYYDLKPNAECASSARSQALALRYKAEMKGYLFELVITQNFLARGKFSFQHIV